MIAQMSLMMKQIEDGGNAQDGEFHISDSPAQSSLQSKISFASPSGYKPWGTYQLLLGETQGGSTQISPLHSVLCSKEYNHQHN